MQNNKKSPEIYPEIFILLFTLENPFFLYVIAQKHYYNLKNYLDNGCHQRGTDAESGNQTGQANNRYKGLHHTQAVIFKHCLPVVFLAAENIEGVHIEVEYRGQNTCYYLGLDRSGGTGNAKTYTGTHKAKVEQIIQQPGQNAADNISEP